MNAKLTPGVIILALILGTMVGPATQLKSVTADNLQDAGYMWELLAQTVGSLATSVLTITGIVAAALGLPILRKGDDA